MEAGTINRKISLLSFFIGIMALFIICCHTNREGKSASDETEWVEVQDDHDGEFLPQDVRLIKDAAIKYLLPIATGKDKEELHNIIEYLENIQKASPDYFNAPDNSIDFLKHLMRLALMEGRLKPDDFKAQLNISHQYLMTAQTIKQFKPTDAYEDLIEKYEKKGIQTARDLIEQFPENGVAYGHLAHSLYITGGDAATSLELCKRCLELEKDSQFCQEGYDALRNNQD